MNICLFDKEEIKNPLSKKDERAQHIIKVLHKKAGDTFDAGIIGGAAGTARIIKISDDGEIFFDFEAKSAGKKLYPLTLIIGFPRPIQLRRLLRDVAGLGCEKVILTGTELTEKSYLNSNVVKDGSAYEMLLDGTAQAASTHVPKLFFYNNLYDTLKSLKDENSSSKAGLTSGSKSRLTSGLKSGFGAGFGKWESCSKIALDNRRAKKSLHDFLLHESALNVVAAIGSERGWTEKERDLLEEFGFTLCSMGSRVLRTETAATVASSIILDSMGYLS